MIFHCHDFGIDGPGVIRAKEGYRRLKQSIQIKQAACRQQGFQYPSEFTSIANCNNEDDFDGQFFYADAIEYCTQVINLETCPPSGTPFNTWTFFLLQRCNLGSVYWLNTKRPLEGKFLWFPGGDNIYTNCI